MNCPITVDQVLNYKFNCTGQEICCSYETLECNLEAAIEAVEMYIGYNLCPDVQTVEVSSTGKNKLFLQPAINQPIISICNDTITNISEDKEIKVENMGEWLEVYEGGCFPCGTMQVCGVFGLDTVPAQVKRSIAVLTYEFTQPGYTGLANPNGISRASWDDMAITYRDDATFDTFGRTTGIKAVDEILYNYINQRGMIQIIPTYGDCPPNCCKSSCNCCDSNGSCGCSGT